MIATFSRRRDRLQLAPRLRRGDRQITRWLEALAYAIPVSRGRASPTRRVPGGARRWRKGTPSRTRDGGDVPGVIAFPQVWFGQSEDGHSSASLATTCPQGRVGGQGYYIGTTLHIKRSNPQPSRLAFFSNRRLNFSCAEWDQTEPVRAAAGSTTSTRNRLVPRFPRGH